MTSTTFFKNNSVKRDVVVVNKKDFERMMKENAELRLALKAILAGELALRYGKTRSLALFLESRKQKYAKDK